METLISATRLKNNCLFLIKNRPLNIPKNREKSMKKLPFLVGINKTRTLAFVGWTVNHEFIICQKACVDVSFHKTASALNLNRQHKKMWYFGMVFKMPVRYEEWIYNFLGDKKGLVYLHISMVPFLWHKVNMAMIKF